MDRKGICAHCNERRMIDYLPLILCKTCFDDLWRSMKKHKQEREEEEKRNIPCAACGWSVCNKCFNAGK